MSVFHMIVTTCVPQITGMSGNAVIPPPTFIVSMYQDSVTRNQTM